MKSYISKFCGVFIATLLVFSACKKEETQAVLNRGGNMTLTSDSTSITLDSTRANALNLTWTSADFGYQAAIIYTIEIAKNDSFLTPISIVNDNLTKKGIATVDLNTKLVSAGYTPAAIADAKFRIKADIGSKVQPIYSNILNVKVKPYVTVRIYPALYVPGNFQGWTPATAYKISSAITTKKFEGYINMDDPTPAFKFVDAPDWAHGIFGDANASGTTGTLPTSGNGNDIKLIGSGYYKLNVDLLGLTYSATKTVWAIIGPADIDWNTESQMTYDGPTATWKITKNLQVGDFKFRANNAWTLNFGDNLGDFNLSYGGINNNIKILVAGNYTITLDLTKGEGGYTYKVKKN
jgi:starch-binding outer membrane protein SusE/F